MNKEPELFDKMKLSKLSDLRQTCAQLPAHNATKANEWLCSIARTAYVTKSRVYFRVSFEANRSCGVTTIATRRLTKSLKALVEANFCAIPGSTSSALFNRNGETPTYYREY